MLQTPSDALLSPDSLPADEEEPAFLLTDSESFPHSHASVASASEVAMLPRLAEMTTALCTKGVSIVQSLHSCADDADTAWALYELDAGVHALHAAVSQLLCLVQLPQVSPKARAGAFADLAPLVEATCSAGETLALQLEGDGRRADKLAAEASLETTVMERRLERAEELAGLVRRYLARRRAAAGSETPAIRRLVEREAAESAQLRDARLLHAQAKAAAETFVLLVEARARLCALVSTVRSTATALQRALLPLVVAQEAVSDRGELRVLHELAQELQMPLLQMGADMVRLTLCEQALARALAAIRHHTGT